MTRDELIEKMAREIFLTERWLSLQEEFGIGLSWDDAMNRRSQSPTCAALIDLAIASATRAVSAIESAGLAIVPREASAGMIRAAIGDDIGPDHYYDMKPSLEKKWVDMVEEGRVK